MHAKTLHAHLQLNVLAPYVLSFLFPVSSRIVTSENVLISLWELRLPYSRIRCPKSIRVLCHSPIPVRVEFRLRSSHDPVCIGLICKQSTCGEMWLLVKGAQPLGTFLGPTFPVLGICDLIATLWLHSKPRHLARVPLQGQDPRKRLPRSLYRHAFFKSLWIL